MSATIRIVADLMKVSFLSLELKLFLDEAAKIVNADPLLFHGITVSDRYAVIGRSVIVSHGFKVNGDAEGSPDFILTAISFADRTRLVIIDHKVFRKLCINLFCLISKLF